MELLVGLFVLLSKAYPSNHAPGIEIPGELVLIAVARHQHHNSPIVDVLQVDGGCGTQIAREDFRGLDHHLLPDPRLWDLSFQLRGAWPLPIHHSSLFFSVPLICKGRTKERDASPPGGGGCGTSNVCYNNGRVVVPLLGGKGRWTGRSTTSRKHRRYGTTRVCCSGWRSPLLTGAASLVRIFLLSRVPPVYPRERPALNS